MRTLNAHLRWRGIAMIIVATAMAGLPAYASATIVPKSLGGLRAIYAPRAQAAGFPPMILGGFTPQHWPVVFFVTANGTRLRVAAIGLTMSCTSGASFGAMSAVVNLRIGTNGTVSANSVIPPSAGATVSLTGGSSSFRAKLNRKLATIAGTWDLQENFAFPDGQTDHCDSGQVRFFAAI